MSGYKPTKVQIWRVILSPWQTDICLSSIEHAPFFYPLSLPLEAAEAVFGKEVVDTITETPVLATLAMQVDEKE